MKYDELIKEITKHDKAYYVNNKSIITDAVYDALYDKLEIMEKNQGWKRSDSPTLKVGGGFGGKIQHPYRLYSTKKVYNIEDVDPSFTVQTPKIDGTNLTLIFKGTKIRLALTRGDGQFGNDVTHLVPYLKGIPFDFGPAIPSSMVIIGECVTDNKVENFRNYVSGALGLKDLEEFKSRNIRFIVHDWLDYPENYTDRIITLEKYGFNTVLNTDFCSQYPQDGIIYRTDKKIIEQQLGYTYKYPRFMVALKERGVKTATTVLQRVEWEVGRTGTVNPVGIVDPVVLDDATITRVTLHNLEFIENMDLGIGDTIEIERAGGVIPKILRVITHSKHNSKVTLEDAEKAIGGAVKRNGPKIYVVDPSEHGTVKFLQHFIKTIGIKGLGPQSITKMGLEHPVDLYKYQNWDLLGANGAKIIEEIKRSKTKPYNVVLAALGIEGVGRTASDKIVNQIPTFARLREIEYENIPTIGPKTIEKILIWLDENEYWVKQLPLQLEQAFDIVDIPVSTRKVCITGKADMTKSQLTELLEEKGFKVSNTVTKDCYALISAGDTSSKTKKATQYGIPVIDYWTNKKNILSGQF